MKIYFLRHGLAEDRQVFAQVNEDDGKRPLTKEGKKLLKSSAKVIVELVPDLDAIITSPLTRALQTARILAKAFEMKTAVVEDSRLSPGFGMEALGAIVREYPDAKGLIFIGHEPDFSQTLSALTGGGSIVCKKGSLARVDILQIEPLQGELVWLIPPKVLARG